MFLGLKCAIKLKVREIFQELNVHLKKPANAKIPFKSICAKIYAKFLCKNYAICFLLIKAFHRFSLVKIK